MDILFINACVRENSRTFDLANHLLDKLEGKVCQIDLNNEKLKPLNRESLKKRNLLIDAGDLKAPEFDYARQFSQADSIVIAAPYWDLGFPALLKIYLEQITVCGITFKYDETGIPQGLCNAKNLFYVTTAGGPVVHDFGYSYIKSLATGFYGITDVNCFMAQNLDVIGVNVKQQLDKTKKQIDNFFKTV